MKFHWSKRTRIIPASQGTKGKDWRRYYKVQQKSLIGIWFTVREFIYEDTAKKWIQDTFKKQMNCKCWED